MDNIIVDCFLTHSVVQSIALLIAHLRKYSTLDHRKLLICVWTYLTVYQHNRFALTKRKFFFKIQYH